MRLADGVHVQWIGDEAVVLNEETGFLHYLNSPAEVVLATILEHGAEEGAAILSNTYGPEHLTDEQRAAVVDDLREKGVLVDDRADA